MTSGTTVSMRPSFFVFRRPVGGTAIEAVPGGWTDQTKEGTAALRIGVRGRVAASRLRTAPLFAGLFVRIGATAPRCVVVAEERRRLAPTQRPPILSHHPGSQRLRRFPPQAASRDPLR